MSETEHSLFKAAIEVAIEKVSEALKLARKRVVAPSVRVRLNAALVELLLISPDTDGVERVIREAEELGFDGDELRRAKDRLALVRSGPKAALGKSGKKAKARKPAKRKPAMGARKKNARAKTYKRSGTYKSSYRSGSRSGAKGSRR